VLRSLQLSYDEADVLYWKRISVEVEYKLPHGWHVSNAGFGVPPSPPEGPQMRDLIRERLNLLTLTERNLPTNALDDPMWPRWFEHERAVAPLGGTAATSTTRCGSTASASAPTATHRACCCTSRRSSAWRHRHRLCRRRRKGLRCPGARAPDHRQPATTGARPRPRFFLEASSSTTGRRARPLLRPIGRQGRATTFASRRRTLRPRHHFRSVDEDYRQITMDPRQTAV
jgi:hypothetical protein